MEISESVVMVYGGLVLLLFSIIGFFLAKFINTVERLVGLMAELKVSISEVRADSKRGYDALNILIGEHSRRIQKLEDKLEA